MSVKVISTDQNLVASITSFNNGKCPKTLYIKVSDKMACASSKDPVQEQSDQGLHYLPFHWVFQEETA